MPEPAIRTLLWDVGGVVLTNGWDHHARNAAAKRFGIDPQDMHQRHETVVVDFETGQIGIDAYLNRVVFCRDQPFSRDEFLGCMREFSKPHEATLSVARALAKAGTYRMATLNNESAYLNEYRIRTFALDSIFELFFSSCYVAMMKPDRRIYELAAAVTRTEPDRCLFIDDRAYNAEAAREAGLHAIHHDGDAVHLVEALRGHGVEVTPTVPAPR